MKKALSVALLGALALTAVGGTLAYFTDTDAETNTFTIGNVEIDLIESQYHRTNAGKPANTPEPIIGGYLWANVESLDGTPDNTPDFASPNTQWTGTYFSDEWIETDAAVYKQENGYFENMSQNMVPGDNVRKNAYIKNTGKNDAYIRAYAYVPVDLFVVLDPESYWVGSGYDKGAYVSESVKVYRACTKAQYAPEDSNTPMSKGEYILANNLLPIENRDGIDYVVFDFTYTQALAPDAVTFWNFWGNIAIDKNATADDLENIDSFDIIFEADAIQADGFADYKAAFAAFDAQNAPAVQS